MIDLLIWVDILLLCTANVYLGRWFGLRGLRQGGVASVAGIVLWTIGLWLLVFLQDAHSFHLNCWHAVLFPLSLVLSYRFHRARRDGILLRTLMEPWAEKRLRQLTVEQPDSHEAHYHLAMVLREKGLYAAAEQEFRKAIEIHPVAIYYHDLGALLFRLGRYDEARTEIEKAIHFRPKDTANMPRFLNTFASILANKGEIEEAVPLWEEAAALGEHIARRSWEEPVGFRKALENLNKARQVKTIEASSHTDQRAWNTYKEAVTILEQGKLLASIQRFLRARKFFDEFHNNAGAAQAMLGLARVYSVNGNPAQALACIKDASKYASVSGSSHLCALIVLEKARTMHSFFADDDSALKLVEEARQLSGEVAGDAFEITGIVASGRNAWKEALRSFESARKAFLSSGSREDADRQLINKANTLLQLGIYLLRRNEKERAHQIFHQSVLVWKELEKSRRRLESAFDLSSKGFAYFQAGFVRQSKRLLNKSTKARREGVAFPDRSLAFYRRGTVFREEGNLQEAYHDFQIAVDCIEAMRSTLMTDWQKERILSRERVFMYEDMVLLCLRSADVDYLDEASSTQAFEYIERAKSRAFLDMLERSKLETEHIDGEFNRGTPLTFRETRKYLEKPVSL